MKTVVRASVATLALMLAVSSSRAGDVPADVQTQAPWRIAVNPKPLSPAVKKGLVWLVERQHASGGWSQGEESAQMRQRGDAERDPPEVGDTAITLLALLRSGSSPTNGEVAAAIQRGVGFLCAEIEAADEASLYVTAVRGTRLQGKLGAFVDTFLASLVLPEVKGRMPTAEANQRVEAALNKVLAKIERNQQKDGSFGGGGWANALSQSLASKGVNRAAQAGAVVKDEVRARLEKSAQGRMSAGGDFRADDAAGVALYAASASLSGMQDAENTNVGERDALQARLAQSPAAEERQAIEEQLRRYEANEARLQEAKSAIVARMQDEAFIAGFGSNGGEEFLSYMNIGESLVVEGGAAWEKWDRDITLNLEKIQNEDGSWTGHHCITGRNFCTASALLVLMTDRAPVPVAAQIKR